MYFDAPDGRMVFAVKREGKVYVGTTDTEYHESKETPLCTTEDKTYLLAAINAMFKNLNLGESSIESCWAGLRPLIHEKGKSPSELSRKDEVFTAKNGLISIAGGKLTAFRKMAQKIVDRLEFKEKNFGGCRTHDILLTGSVGESANGYKDLRTKLCTYQSKFSDHKNIMRLVHSYGNACFDMMELAKDDKSLILSEIDYCIKNESLEHLGDYYSRRSGKILFAADEVKLNHMDLLAHFSKQKGLSVSQIRTEEKLFEQLKKEALVNL
jgi:glycerol-3-phosphate dehydrogenase